MQVNIWFLWKLWKLMVEMWKFDWLESKIAFEKCSTWNFYTFPNEYVILHVWHHKSKPLVGLDIWISKQTIDKPERWNYKTIRKWWKNCPTSCSCFYINKPQIVKKCKESVNTMYHVYKIKEWKDLRGSKCKSPKKVQTSCIETTQKNAYWCK